MTLFAAPPAVNYPVFISAAIDGTLYVSSDGNGSTGRQPNRAASFACAIPRATGGPPR